MAQMTQRCTGGGFLTGGLPGNPGKRWPDIERYSWVWVAEP